MKLTQQDIRDAAMSCLIEAGTTYRSDQFQAYKKAIALERIENAKWVMEQIVENAHIAENDKIPLCDDSGIPHVIVHIGDECELPKGWLSAIEIGVKEGLRQMPGRPMAVLGNDIERVEQSKGLNPDPGGLELAPIILRRAKGKKLKLTVLLLGGGPEIRAKTRRIFHRRSIDHVINEVICFLNDEVGSMGCTPSIPAIGLGRSQVEASALMLHAMAEGSLDEQSELERKVTDGINASKIGPIGMGGDATVMGCFLKIGPTRASGVRIVCARPCCLVEPRRATRILK